MTYKKLSFVCAVVLAVCVSSANAAIVGVVNVEADTGGESYAADILITNGPGKDTEKFNWTLPEPVEIRDGQGNLILTVDNLDVMLDADPVVTANFAVTAGNFPANVNISTGTAVFAALSNPDAKAGASISFTDNSVPGNGVSGGLTGGNTGMFIATYNGSSTYAELLGAMSTTGFNTGMSSDTGPFATLNASVTSIEASFEFSLTANDSAAGNGRFEVLIPEPSSIALCSLALAGLAMVRRRK